MSANDYVIVLRHTKGRVGERFQVLHCPCADVDPETYTIRNASHIKQADDMKTKKEALSLACEYDSEYGIVEIETSYSISELIQNQSF